MVPEYGSRTQKILSDIVVSATKQKFFIEIARRLVAINRAISTPEAANPRSARAVARNQAGEPQGAESAL